MPGSRLHSPERLSVLKQSRGFRTTSFSSACSARGTMPTTHCSSRHKHARSSIPSKAKHWRAMKRSCRAWLYSRTKRLRSFTGTLESCLRRDLVQQRSVWRAVLPHAIANRLAVRALEDTPYDLIDQQLVMGGTDRLALIFLAKAVHSCMRAPAPSLSSTIGLQPGGLLGDAAAFNDLGHRAMFENVAPVSPEAALAVLERAGERDPEVATMVLRQNRSLLRSLAYDPLLFERSISVVGPGGNTQFRRDRHQGNFGYVHPLCANDHETVTPRKFRLEGEGE